MCLLGRNLFLINFYTLEGLWPSFWPQLTKGFSFLGLGKLYTQVIRKTQPSSILAFSKSVRLG